MRIALVSEHASPLATLGGVDAGGQNVHVAALARSFAQLGHSVTVYTRRDAPSLPMRVPMGARVHVEHVDAGPPLPIPKDAIYDHLPAFAAHLRRAWTRDRPDIVHSHFWMSGLATLAAARPLGLPVVHTFHALGAEKRRHQGSADTSPTTRIAEEMRIAREADRIVATASSEMFELMRMGARARGVKIVPCGVDLDAFTPGGPAEPRRTDRMRIVTLSRLVPRKGIDTAIEALAHVPHAELIVAGGGESAELVDDPEANRLAELARRCGVGTRVYLRGRVERGDVPALLRSADVVVCTPWYEPFGIVPLEAMACGKPLVVSAVGGLVDTVVDGITGLHVPPRNPARLADALNAMRLDVARRESMGRAGAERAHGRYSWLRVAADTLHVYRALRRAFAAGTVATGS
ncbi:MAG TPA: glycosyltransferase [Candidatus Elarobacter sp.]|jgi:glycosyltransferase involved in cell wall biosynthesis